MKKACYNDRICIVTDANSGIGYAHPEELLKRGATVYMAGRACLLITPALATRARLKKKRSLTGRL